MNMKKLFVLIFVIISFNSFADCGNEHSSRLAKTTTFTNEIFQKAQLEGKVVVINSWNKPLNLEFLKPFDFLNNFSWQPSDLNIKRLPNH